MFLPNLGPNFLRSIINFSLYKESESFWIMMFFIFISSKIKSLNPKIHSKFSPTRIISSNGCLTRILLDFLIDRPAEHISLMVSILFKKSSSFGNKLVVGQFNRCTLFPPVNLVYISSEINGINGDNTLVIFNNTVNKVS